MHLPQLHYHKFEHNQYGDIQSAATKYTKLVTYYKLHNVNCQQSTIQVDFPILKVRFCILKIDIVKTALQVTPEGQNVIASFTYFVS